MVPASPSKPRSRGLEPAARLRILVTAGPTREYLDSVRFLSNPSSGKMGYAIAAETARRGHKVFLITGPVDLPEPKGVKVTRVDTAEEMFRASVANFKRCDAVIMTAAVCDYRPARRAKWKLKKQQVPKSLKLVPTRDILAHLGRIKGRRLVIGFAMEDHNQRRNAESKLRRKRCDAILLNGIGNVGSNSATIEVLLADGKWFGPYSGTKKRIASIIVELVESGRSTESGS